MKSLISGILCCALLGAVIEARANVTNTVDSAATWNGFMNVFELPANGGAYVFGSTWGTADLVATFSGSTLTLMPNSINDPNSFWYTPSGGPGAAGNKQMEANMYIEYPTNSGINGQILTFRANVTAYTLSNTHTAIAFIKDFAPDYSTFATTTVALTPGVFSINLATVADPNRHVQYGFQVVGPDVWSTDVGPYGSVQVAPVGGAPIAQKITPSVSAGTLNLSFPTESGRTYTVQVKTNLTDPTWGTLTVTNGPGTAVKVTTPATGPYRFFRLSIQ